MRKLAVVMALILALMLASIAFAQPPSDPTCGHGNPNFDCPGDNGNEGCRGIQEADDHNPEQSDDAMDLVTDILDEGPEGDC